MSDGLSSAPVAVEPAITSTHEAAEAVIEAYESTPDETPDPAPDPGPDVASPITPRAVTPESAPDQTPAPVVLTEAERLLAEDGFAEARRPDGRENRIPYSKVKKIIENGLKKGAASLETRATAAETAAAALRGQMEQLREGVRRDPDAFLADLATVDPRYRKFLAPAAAPAPVVPDPASTKPQPDVDLGDGRWTYSQEGMEALTAWKTEQVLAARLKPWEDREAAAVAAQKEREIGQAMQHRAGAAMQAAQSWPLFGPLSPDGVLTEVQTAVLGELQRDTREAQAARRAPSLTLEGAYIRVMGPKFAAQQNDQRAAVLKAAATAPRAPAVARGGADAPAVQTGVQTADVAARIYAKLERG